MGGGFQLGKLSQNFKVRLVTLSIHFFKNVIEVAQGLMVVDAKEKF